MSWLGIAHYNDAYVTRTEESRSIHSGLTTNHALSFLLGQINVKSKSKSCSFLSLGSASLVVLLMTTAYQARADSSIRIRAGGPAYTDSSGNVWGADSNYQGGTTYTTQQPISNTSDPALYQTERYGNPSYTWSVPNGSYTITLKFAELYWNAIGSRVFNVSVNGIQVLSNFDIFASAGGQYKAIDKSFPVTVSAGSINIAFSSVVDNAKIDAIQILSQTTTVTTPPATNALFRINAGGAVYTDSSGNVWNADQNYQGGSTYSTNQAVANTSDPTLYQTERYGTMAYNFNVPNGNYNVILKFAELYWNTKGSRVFDVAINNSQALSNFDIFAAAGGQYKAIDQSFPVTVTNGAVNIAFNSVIDNAKVDAIEIDQLSSSGSGVPATSANTFLSSLGVNVHIAEGYNFSNYVAPLQYLGVRNIRDGALNLSSTNQLHQQTGVKVDIGVSCNQLGANANATFSSIIQYLSSAGALLFIEGPNEPNNFPITYNGQQGGGTCATCTWVPVAACQRDLYSGVKSNTSLSQYPVLTVSLAGAETDNVGLQFLTIPSASGTAMPAGTQYGDYANQHNYVSSNNANLYEDNQAWMAADTQQNSFPGDILYSEFGVTFYKQYAGYSANQLQTLPRITTETGWDSVTNPGGETVQGKVLTNTYLAQFKRGSAYTFIYELIDGEGGAGNQGLFSSNYTAKPAATYIHNLTTILADTGSLPNPGVVNYFITNEPATVHDLLLQKSDGTFELVIWDERASSSDNVTVNFASSLATVNVYDIISGASPTQTLTNTSSISLSLSDHAVILEFK